MSETITDLGTLLPVPLVGPPPLSFVFPEAGEPFDIPLGLPGREINFIEPQTQTISDRLSISQYQVRVASDDNPLGLPRRTTQATLIPFTALESFQPIRITASSDGEIPNQATGSDTLTITTGWFGPGTGTVVFTGTLPELVPEGATEPPLTFFVPPAFFDIEEPPIEAGGQLGVISDYIDLIQGVEVRFISADDPAVFAGLPPANGFVVENFETGGGVRYSLDFRSDAVPEPASFALLGIALLSAGLFGYRRKAR